MRGYVTCFSLVSNQWPHTVVGYQYVFGFGLLGAFLFQFFVEDRNFSKGAILLLELLPGFALYRGLYEFSQYSLTGYYQGTRGMQWKNMKDVENGMPQVFIIMFLEWLLITPFSFYLDQFFQSNNSSFLGEKLKHLHQYLLGQRMKVQDFDTQIEINKLDVLDEKKSVSEILASDATSCAIVCDDLRKVYHGENRAASKYAVRGLSLAVPCGQCFGMLGPNGAGKTSSINMVFADDWALKAHFRYSIYKRAGHQERHESNLSILLWKSLTGREHLLFYGRLKNLKGEILDNVVYMDEPSAGLDPASRNLLWNVVRKAKQGRAIILTTHSMEEAETLCDRVGIFVKGQLQCIGNCTELKSRYGASYIFTISTPPSQEDEVVRMALELSSSSKQIYSLAGTQKFEISKTDVTIADVFRAVVNAKACLNILAWGFTDTTLEDVFIKVVDEGL
ncbi:hypothetical protein GOP47_0007285 [Adiantum capillus-veneris]|uniref:ABC transporter domain-containing protein n=1 Tax=Adiantum capillus-veneris TaxID=13818 RepID=A0A9D4V0E2_ADICA|nr:hypothetical protein GOP47_0007285 [Adiantum capillus-veneris]